MNMGQTDYFLIRKGNRRDGLDSSEPWIQAHDFCAVFAADSSDLVFSSLVNCGLFGSKNAIN